MDTNNEQPAVKNKPTLFSVKIIIVILVAAIILIGAGAALFSNEEIRSISVFNLKSIIGQQEISSETTPTCTTFDTLAEAMESADEACTLNLSGQDIPTLPIELGLFPNLIHLDLSSNLLETLDTELSPLEQVKTVSLIDNPLSEEEKMKAQEIFPFADITY